MKYPLILTAFLISLNALGQSMDKQSNSIFSDPYISPSLHGSYDSLITANAYRLKKPVGCDGNKVLVKFVVDTTGKVQNPEIFKGICPQADTVALDIVRNLQFYPARINNKKVEVKQLFPIDFKD